LRFILPSLIRHKEERVEQRPPLQMRMMIQELLEYIEEIERKLEEMQQSSERQFNEIRKRLDKIEEKLNQRD
jgi:tetrahydromethanopterin S-methyltransferase subunit G